MTTSHFDCIAGAYDDSLPAHVVGHYLDKRARFVRRHCPVGQVLDVGCGTGRLAGRLAGEGYDVVGIDPSAEMLQILRTRSPDVEAVEGSGTSLPFEDDSFDLVLSVAVMHHIADPGDVRATLAEMTRVARPGGRILVWDHNPRNPYWPRVMARVPQDTGDERLIEESEIVAGLRAAHAEPLLVAQLGLMPDFVPRALLRLAAASERAVERMPLVRRMCAHNVVLAVKH